MDSNDGSVMDSDRDSMIGGGNLGALFGLSLFW